MEDLSPIIISWRSALMFSVCLSTLMIAIFLSIRAIERRACIFLGLLLFAAVIAMIPQIIGFSGFYQRWPGLTFAPFATELYLGPLLYLHAYSLMDGRPLGWRKWLLIPGLVQTLYYSWAFLFLGDYQNKWAFTASFHGPYIIPIETLLGLGLFAFALWQIYHLVKQYYRFLEHSQSATSDFEPVWLKRLLLFSIPMGLLFLLIEFVPAFITRVSYVEAYPLQVAIMIVLVWLGFDALSRINQTFPKMSERIGEDIEIQEKDWQEEARRLQQAMLKEQWYLESRLSLRQVAERLGSNESYISRTINKGMDKTFNTYINTLRIDNAKQLMQQTDKPILTIALDSGFNSKATFNRVFKEQTGLTPSQYKKSQNP